MLINIFFEPEDENQVKDKYFNENPNKDSNVDFSFTVDKYSESKSQVSVFHPKKVLLELKTTVSTLEPMGNIYAIVTKKDNREPWISSRYITSEPTKYKSYSPIFLYISGRNTKSPYRLWF